jgi:hypothetical protein
MNRPAEHGLDAYITLCGESPGASTGRGRITKGASMFRTSLCALFVLVLVAGTAPAREFTGTIKKIDVENKVLTVAGDCMDKEFQITDETKLVNNKGKAIKEGLKNKRLKTGVSVTVYTTKKNGKDIVTRIQFDTK